MAGTVSSSPLSLCVLSAAAAILSLPPVLTAQQGRVIELKSARELHVRTINDQEVRELIGNVHFVQPAAGEPDVRLWCDRALRFTGENRIELYGNVRIVRDTVTLTSDRGVYFGDRRYARVMESVRLLRGGALLTAREGEYDIDRKTAVFRGDVTVMDSVSTTTCDSLRYDEEDARSIAIGRVRVVDHGANMTVFGDSLIHLQSSGYSRVPANPRLVQIDSTETGNVDTLVVVSRVMEQLPDSSRVFVASGDVVLARDDLAAQCGEARFRRAENVILLQDRPVIWYGDRQIMGDSMRIVLENNRLKLIEVFERAVAVSRSDTARPDRYDQLTGRFLALAFRDQRLERIVADQTATSLTFLFDEDQPNGANRSSGDRIVIEFEEGTVEQIRVLGGVEGTYVPENMVRNREGEYRLDGFRWDTERPSRSGTTIVMTRHE